MRISVVGAGYVGLVTGACLAEKGHQVICVDVDEAKIALIDQGLSPIYEAGLGELLKKNIHRGLWATTDLHQAVIDTDLTMIVVGTPFDGKQIDLTHVQEAAHQIGTAIHDKDAYHVVVVKSTVVPGTTDQVVLPILERASGKSAGCDFGIGVNPEFLTEGVAVQDFMDPDRIVVGGIDRQCVERIAALYQDFPGVELIRTNNQSAEMIKYASNALLATMISFSNEIANLCQSIGGIDVVDVMKGVHQSHYLSPRLADGTRQLAPIAAFLEAGCGFGGSCLPKDVKALIAHGESHGRSMDLLKAVITINEEQPKAVISLLKKHFPVLEGIKVAVLGLAFKPDTGDMRESPAIPIIRHLIAEKAVIKTYDPAANEEAQRWFGDEILICEQIGEAVDDSQAIILVTRWEEFQRLPEMIAKLDPQPVLIDGRRYLDKTSVQRYEGIGWLPQQPIAAVDGLVNR